MNIQQEARTIAQSIMTWCYLKETRNDDEDYPSHIVENLLERQKAELTEKACKWLFSNFYHEETMVDCIAYEHEDEDINAMIEQFREAMEE